MGKWNEKDFLFSKNLYSTNNNCVQSFDLLGLFIKSSCDIKDKLKTIYNVDTRKENKSRYIYKHVYNRQSSPSLSNEIVQNMILSTATYEIKGRKIEDIMKDLDKHVMTRTTIVQIAQKFKIKFPNEDGKEGNIKRMINKLKRAKNLEERIKIFDEYNEKKDLYLACYDATKLIMSTGSNPDKKLLERTYEEIHIPGDWLYIKNNHPRADTFLEGENLIYLGGDQYWGTSGAPQMKSYQDWYEEVYSWNGSATSKNTIMRFPHEGITI